MFFDIEITEELLKVPLTPPKLIRQYASLNLNKLNIDAEVNFDEHIFRSVPNFDNSGNLPYLKRYNSDLKQITKSPSLKRINTF